MLGWFLIAPYVGAFSRKKTDRPGKMAFYTILAWLPSLVLGVTFRSITVDHQVPSPTFMVVTLITNAIFLSIWRVPFAWLTGRRK
jgi:undecaprenyl pyrophosphate phosphatase UppP